ncbi:MAG: V-type ATP synthase subunit D [Nitrospinota bacterium]
MPENKNRLQLLKLRNKKKIVERAVTILSDKRDALMKEFHGVSRHALKARRELEKKIQTASRLLLLARGIEPHNRLVTAALAARKNELSPVNVNNIWGVKIPVIEHTEHERGLFEIGSAPGFRSPVVDETADGFGKVNNALIVSAVAESHIMVIGGALRSTNRRVNALERLIVPKIASEIEGIRSRLEEMSREELFRLKRYKRLKRRSILQQG